MRASIFQNDFGYRIILVNLVAVVRYNYYQYGQVQGDVTLKHNVGFNCERNGKSCSSDFINVPKIQIFNGQYKRLRVRV